MGGDVSPPKFELGGHSILCPPLKLINIMVKYHAPTKTEQGKLNCYPLKTVSWSFLRTSEENLYKFGRTYRYIIKYFKYLFIIYLTKYFMASIHMTHNCSQMLHVKPPILFGLPPLIGLTVPLKGAQISKIFWTGGGSSQPPPQSWTGSLRSPNTPLSPPTFWN